MSLRPTDLMFYNSTYLAYRKSEPEAKIIPLEQTSDFASAISLAKKWHDAGYTNSGEMLTKNQGFDGMLQLGKLASIVTDWGRACEYVRARGSVYKLKAYPLYMDRPAYKSISTGESIVFTRNMKNAELVLKFIEWVHSSQENYDLLMYGVEGYDYWIKDGKVNLPKSSFPYNTWFGSDAFIDIKHVRSLETEPVDFKEYYKYVVDYNAEHPSIEGFAYDTSKFSVMVERRQKAYTKLLYDLDYEIFNMSLDIFIEDQKKAGADELAEKIQIQLDEWMKNKKG